MGGKTIPNGAPVTCGSTIRLMHHKAMQNLHAWSTDSHVSHQQEVSLFGSTGSGDDGDNWVVYCENNTEHSYAKNWASFVWDVRFHRERFQMFMSEHNKYWKRDTPFRLWHPNTNTWLNFADERLPEQLCPSCAKKGMREVTAILHPRHGNEPSFRWYVKQVLSVPIECDAFAEKASSPGHQWSVSKSWAISHRPIRVGDFVAWRNVPTTPCENLGRTQIGQVTQVFGASRTILIEEWSRVNAKHQQIQRYSSFFPLNLQKEYSH